MILVHRIGLKISLRISFHAFPLFHSCVHMQEMAYAMLAQAHEAQRVARNYAKAAKRSLKAVQALQKACLAENMCFFFPKKMCHKHVHGAPASFLACHA